MATKSPQNKAAKQKAAPKPIFIINRGNVMGWIFLAFAGCGLMFILGVLVGRDQAPIRFDIKRLDEKLTHLKQSVLTTKEIKPFDVIGNLKKKGMPEVEETDSHTVSPRYAKKKMTEEPISPEALHPNPKNPEPEPNSGELDDAGQRPESEAAPSPPEKTEPQPDTSPEPAPVKKPAVSKPHRQASVQTTASTRHSGVDGFAIQIASLSDPESAALVRDRFLAKGYPAYCRKAAVNGKTWHRVRIGPYPSREKARRDLKNLTEAGVSAMIFLREGNP